MTLDEIDVPHALVHVLEEAGIQFVFGMPGGDTGRIFDALHDSREIQTILVRHEHEWVVFREIRLPDDRVIIPGVLDSTTNFIEHPELVAQRLVRYAEIVGRERVIAGTDCGFATFARSVNQVEPEITWAKFKAMAEGARLASKQLWK